MIEYVRPIALNPLYKILYCHEEPQIAKNQLSFKYLHVKWAKTGILDKFVSEYERYFVKDKNPNFLKWVKSHYDPYKLEKSFKENKLIDKIIFKIFRRE